MGIGLFYQVTSNRTRGYCLVLCQGRSRWDIRKKLFMERIVKHWNKLPREVIVTSLKVFKRTEGVVLRDMVYWGFAVSG